MDISFVLRKFRKSISGFTILALLASFMSFATVAQASSFSDTDGHWGEAYIEALAGAGVVSGNPDGTFNPDGTLNRAELSKMLVLGYTEGLVDGASNPYADVSEDDWYVDYAASAYSYGIMTGEGDGSFNGGGSVNRATLMQAVYNAAGLTDLDIELPFDDVMSSDWYYDAVVAGYGWSIVDGESSDTFNPGGYATRAAAAKVIYNGWYPEEREVTEDPEDPTPSSEGTLNLSLASDNPDGATLPSGATSVEVLALDAMAEGDDVNIDSITFNQFGVSALPSNHSVYVYAEVDGVNTRVSSGQSVNSSTHDITFNNLDIAVEEGETVRVSLRLDVGTVSPAGEAAFQIESADMVDADGADVDGDFALKGESFDLSTTAAGTITIEKNGSVTNPKVGEDGVTIAKFKMTAATEAANLEELGLYISGSINTDDMANFELFVSGEDEAIGSADGVDGLDVVRFTNLDYQISKGGTKSFYVTADFNTGRTSDTVKVYVDENTDLLATGDLYGYGMAVTRSLYDGNADACASSSSVDCSYASLEGGDVTISSNGPAASDIAINGNDVTVMNFDVTAVTDVTFKNFPISLTVTEATSASGLLNSTTANITDIKIVDTESGDEMFSSVDSDVFTTALAGSTAISDTTGDDVQAFHLYTDDWTLEAGAEYSLALTLDIENQSALSGDTLTATLELGSTYPELRDVNNKTLTNSSVLVPASAVSSKTHTLRSPSLALSLASTPVSKTYVKGSDDVRFTGVVFACGDASDCRVTDLTVAGYLDDDADGTYETSSTSTNDAVDNGTALNAYVGSIWVEDADGNVVSGPKSVNGTTFATTFSTIDWTLEAGSTDILYIVGDLSNDSFADGDAEAIAFGVTASTGVTVEDEDGNSFSATGSANTSQTTAVTTSAGGSLTITVDASTPKEDIVVAGTSDQEVSAYKFVSTDEAFVVTDLAINAYQSGVAAANIGDQDNNINSVSISYENSDGETEMASGYLTSGTANLTGLDIYVPADDDTVVTVYVDANTIQSGATAGEYIELNLAFNNFEAIAQGSGETYKASKIDAGVADASDLDFGTITYTTTGVALGTTASAVTLGASATITTADLNVSLPVGTLILVDDNGTYDSTNSTIFALTTKYTDGDTSLTGLVLDDADTTPDNTDNVYYALPGTGYLTGTNSFHLYETKPTLALSASSPSGSRSVSSSDNAFVFTVTADDAEEVQVRTAKHLTTCAVGDDQTGANNAVNATYTTTTIDGSACAPTLTNFESGDTVSFDAGATSVINGYARASFWLYWAEADDDGDPDFADFKYGTATAADAQPIDNLTALAASDCSFVAASSASTLATGNWYYCDVAIHASTDASDRYFNIEFDQIAASAALETGDTLVLDRVILYNDKVEMDLAGDDIDSQANGAHGLIAYLKEGGSTVATSYVVKPTVSASEGGTGRITFFPIDGTDSALVVSDGTTKTYTVQLSTSTLLAEDSGADDPLTFSIDLGSSTTRTVTSGDFWWYDTNAQVKWLGQVESTTLTSNTVNY